MYGILRPPSSVSVLQLRQLLSGESRPTGSSGSGRVGAVRDDFFFGRCGEQAVVAETKSREVGYRRRVHADAGGLGVWLGVGEAESGTPTSSVRLTPCKEKVHQRGDEGGTSNVIARDVPPGREAGLVQIQRLAARHTSPREDHQPA